MPERPVIVVALGGNALAPRRGPTDAAAQIAAARRAARLLAPLAAAHRLVVTHGNGPQVGLLALRDDADPLDVLGAETEGELGYIIELELGNALPGAETVALLTRTEVDADDPAFADPTKPIGATYGREEARGLSADRGWTVTSDGGAWRRVVPSPEPRRIVQLGAIRRLVEGGVLVVCAGGGGVPVVRGADGSHTGVEAVVDKDLASALLATELGAEVLVLATDVDAVYEGFGTAEARPLHEVSPADLRAGTYPAGSMGPKVDAASRFVERGGARAAIGALEAVGDLAAGRVGTQVVREARNGSA